MSNARLIVASARLPVTMSRRQDGWDVSPSTGGLVTALKAVAERRSFTWIGWPGTHVPETERPAVTRALEERGAVPVYISKSQIDGFYSSFSNGMLWPLFHAQAQRAVFDQSGWTAYQAVNEKFADAICEVAKPGDIVWVHDYQLLLVPELLRRRGLNCPIGFFLHIPFPSAETYRTLPAREEILRGVLGADIIGFHAYEYVSHFRNACLRVLGIESEPESLRLQARNVRLGVLPIGIDPGEIREMARGKEARQEYADLQATYTGKKLIVGVDRLDYTKGIPEKLLAFEELLKSRPKWRQRAVLIQIAAPSRTGVDEYKQLKRDVDELVGRINGKYGSPSSTPVVYVNQSVPRNRLVGLYQAADVALVTPVRDGMNLVALEYVAARGDRGGTLVLSEFAGAAHCLPGARLVNPFSTADVADVLAEVLESDSPKPEAFVHMQRFVEDNTSMRWANKCLDQLEAMTDQVRHVSEILDIDKAPLAGQLKTARHPLVLLDYDGTLRSYVVEPKEASPEPRVLELLGALSKVASVYIVSGRSGETLDKWFGGMGIGFACEHGLAIKDPNGQWQRQIDVNATDIIERIQPLLQDFCRRTPGSAIEYKEAAVAWHYRAADPEYGAFQANELLTQLEDQLKRGPFKVLRGSRVIEVRHENVTKGHALMTLAGRHPGADILFCAGDDRTDEEMMAAIPEEWQERAVTCWVGSRNLHAKYWRESNKGFVAQLEKLAKLWQSSGAKPAKIVDSAG